MAELDTVTLHIIYRETMRQIATYRARVSENKDLMAAADFGRYVQWSGIPKLLKAHACDGSLKCDGDLLMHNATELVKACQERWRKNDTKPHIEQTQLASIGEKLDLIAGFLARFPAAPAPIPDEAETSPISQRGANVVPFPAVSDMPETKTS